MQNQFSITKSIIEANLKLSHGITATEKCVLIILSNYFGSRENSTVFSCYPSQARIAREVGCSRSTVNRALQRFEDLGFVRSRWQTNASGGNSSKLYTWLGIPSADERNESEISMNNVETNQLDAEEERTENAEVADGQAPEVTEHLAPTRDPESINHTPTSDWWEALESELEESPF